jgi:hypothetical protein
VNKGLGNGPISGHIDHYPQWHAGFNSTNSRLVVAVEMGGGLLPFAKNLTIKGKIALFPDGRMEPVGPLSGSLPDVTIPLGTSGFAINGLDVSYDFTQKACSISTLIAPPNASDGLSMKVTGTLPLPVTRLELKGQVGVKRCELPFGTVDLVLEFSPLEIRGKIKVPDGAAASLQSVIDLAGDFTINGSGFRSSGKGTLLQTLTHTFDMEVCANGTVRLHANGDAELMGLRGSTSIDATAEPGFKNLTAEVGVTAELEVSNLATSRVEVKAKYNQSDRIRVSASGFNGLSVSFQCLKSANLRQQLIREFRKALDIRERTLARVQERVREVEKEARATAQAAAEKAEQAKREVTDKAEKVKDEARRVEEESRRRAEEIKKEVEAETKRRAEEEVRRVAEEARRRVEEETRRAAEEARRRVEEETRRAAEEARRRVEEETRRAAEEARRLANEARRAEEEARARVERERERARRLLDEARRRSIPGGRGNSWKR